MSISRTTSYHIQSATDGFIMYCRVKCCAQCEFCASKTEYHHPVMSWDDDPVPIQVNYCTKHNVSEDKMTDTSVIAPWCPMVKILADRDAANKSESVADALVSVFPNTVF